jgi:hypothetical protein
MTYHLPLFIPSAADNTIDIILALTLFIAAMYLYDRWYYRNLNK